MTHTSKPGTYSLDVWDHEIPADLQDKVYNFLLDSEYLVNFYDPPHSFWHPRKNEWVTERNMPAAPRLPLAWDDDSLMWRAPIVFELWQKINGDLLNNQFTIEGTPEGMSYMTGMSPVSAVDRPDGSPGRPNVGWRVYGDGREKEYRSRTKEVHRDSVDLNDDSCYTLVYFANQEWHPQYYGETLFHSDDDTTGSYLKNLQGDQKRGFTIGDIENVVAPRPGRVMLFDGRYQHQVKCAAMYAPEPIMGISFRIKRKPQS